MKITVLTGAGISAESGLGTFRDSNGLWEQHKIEDVATPLAWDKNKSLVLEFYNQRRREVRNAKPNIGHESLVELEIHFDVNIITQNIDDLHERAGSKNVLHLHGEIFKAKSHEFDQNYKTILGDINLGDVNEKGVQLRPHVVWFGESVPEMDKAIKIIESSDVLIVIGTSLNVYPAANLIYYLKDDSRIFLVDPSDVEVNVKCTHVKLPATKGVPIVIRDLLLKK
ncbi:MAG: NAD-dependent deacetylase [Crocinitomicaceae bacterium]